MYIPNHFAGAPPGFSLRWLVERYPFATLVTEGGQVSHLPIVLLDHDEPPAMIAAHLARRNPQLNAVRSCTDALVSFVGPHALIPSSWYERPTETPPTWNYVTAVAHVTVQLREDTECAVAHLKDALRTFQAGEAAIDLDALTPATLKHISAITVLEMCVRRWEAKWKLSQNRSAADRARVVEALRRRGTGDDRLIAEMVMAVGP